MLVVVSDLHLMDGTGGTRISPGAFHLLMERMEDMALRASCRADGGYRPVDRIDLLMLGDVLDLIRSTQWLESSVRPWSAVGAPETVSMVDKITERIIQENDEAMGVLRSLASGGVRLPPATARARPGVDEEWQPIPVNIHYMVGNHDWFLHAPGPEYDALRAKVVQAMALRNPADQPFPHDPLESEELLAVLRRHRVMARHGDLYDPLNFSGRRDASSLGDAVVIELLGRFSQVVAQKLGDDLPASSVAGLREIDHVRPTLLVPVWLDGLLQRTCNAPSVRSEVKRIWDQLVDDFLDLSVVRDRDTWNPFEVVDGLQRTLKFSRALPLGWSSAITQWMVKLRGAKSDSFFPHALAEQDFRNRRARHVVYGHTHHFETVPLDASHADGYVLQQTYFNSGTWRRTLRQTQHAPGEHEFVASDTLSYLVFFHGDERRGRPYETWSGSLATAQQPTMIHHFDEGTPSHAGREQVSAPVIRGPHPHFLPRAPQTGSSTRSQVG